MAVFNPQAPGSPTRTPNFTGAAGRAPSGTFGIAATAVEGATKTGAALAEAQDVSNIQDIRGQVRQAQRDELNMLTESMAADKKISDMDLSTKLFHKEGPSVPLPQGIQSGTQEMQRLLSARNAGKLSESSYWARLNKVSKRLRNQYPGYEDEIDSTMDSLTGEIPRQAMTEALMDEATSLSPEQERLQDMTDYLQQAHVVGTLPPKRYARYIENPTLSEGISLQQHAQKQLARQHALETEKQIQTRDVRRKTEVGMTEVGGMFNDFGDFLADDLGYDSWSDMERTIRGRAQSGGRFTPDEMRQSFREVQIIGQQINSSVERMLRSETYANLPQESKDQIRNMAQTQVDLMRESLGTDDAGGWMGAQKALNDAMYEDARGLMFRKVPMLMKFDVLRNSIGTESMAAAWQNNTNVFNDTTKRGLAVKLNLDAVAGSATGDPSNPPRNETMTRGVEDMDRAAMTPKEIRGSIDGLIKTFKETDSPVQATQNMASYLFGMNNDNWWGLSKKDRRHVFRKMTEDGVVNKMKQLRGSAPNVWTMYTNYIKKNFVDLYRSELDTLNNVYERTPFGLTYDPGNNMFEITGLPQTGGTSEFGGLTAPNPAREAVHSMNEALRNFEPVLTENGQDTINEVGFIVDNLNMEVPAGEASLRAKSALNRASQEATQRQSGPSMGDTTADTPSSRTQGSEGVSEGSPQNEDQLLDQFTQYLQDSNRNMAEVQDEVRKRMESQGTAPRDDLFIMSGEGVPSRSLSSTEVLETVDNIANEMAAKHQEADEIVRGIERGIGLTGRDVSYAIRDFLKGVANRAKEQSRDGRASTLAREGLEGQEGGERNAPIADQPDAGISGVDPSYPFVGNFGTIGTRDVPLVNENLRPDENNPTSEGNVVPIVAKFMSHPRIEGEVRNEKGEHVAYQDSGGVWTIGYGHTSAAGGLQVKPGMTISEERAQKLLEKDTTNARKAVEKHVKVDLAPNQKAALTSFVYNVGEGAFSDSTLLQKLNGGDYEGAANELNRWVYDNGRKLRGLEFRRQQERELFLKGESLGVRAASIETAHRGSNIQPFPAPEGEDVPLPRRAPDVPQQERIEVAARAAGTWDTQVITPEERIQQARNLDELESTVENLFGSAESVSRIQESTPTPVRDDTSDLFGPGGTFEGGN